MDLETLPNYKADVVYFGTINGDWTDGFGTEGWGGKLYRLVTRSPAVTSQGATQAVTTPSQWTSLFSATAITPYDTQTNPNVLYDPGQPIITAPTVGTDGRDFWVYFGTGRFFDAADKTDSGSNEVQTFYGIREPVDCLDDSFDGLNWKTVSNTPVSTAVPTTLIRGDNGLLPVEDIAIKQVRNVVKTTPEVVGCNVSGSWSAFADDDSCLPASLPADHALVTNSSFNDLVNYIVGNNVYCYPNSSAASDPGFDGWSKDMTHAKERNLGQATLLGGLISYSTYIPNTNICNPEGSGYLYGVYYQTGTAWIEDVFGRTPEQWDEPIETGVFMGAGLSTTPNIHVGENEGGKTFIQTSVGQIVEIPQPNLPNKNIKSGMIKWRDIE